MENTSATRSPTDRGAATHPRNESVGQAASLSSFSNNATLALTQHPALCAPSIFHSDCALLFIRAAKNTGGEPPVPPPCHRTLLT
jgi:hypothetical protein